METINIPNTRGEAWRTVPVRVFSADRSLAIHSMAADDPKLDSKGWTITHVRTGGALVEGIPFRDAERIMDGVALMYGPELRRIRKAKSPLAKRLKVGVAAVIRATMGVDAPNWTRDN